MRFLYFTIVFVSIFVGLQSCYKEEAVFNSEADCNLELATILRINKKECCFDYAENSLRFPIEDTIIEEFTPFIEFQEYSDVYFEGVKLENKSINNLGKIDVNKSYELIIKSQNVVKKLLLTFTNLPTVQIITPNIIFDEPEAIAKIIINYNETDKASDQYYIGLEYRGSTSQLFPKKSFGFSVKENISLDDKISTSIFDMKKNNDWILDAMWIDKARLRNKTSFDLWLNMDGEKHYGINGEFIELYINNKMQGLYCLTENINAEFLNLNNSDAVLYKATAWGNGATSFEKYSNNPPQNYYWDGWEQKYPEPEFIINWNPLNDLRYLVANEADDVFSSKISSHININNFIDYYIFLNLTSAADNKGKNIFLVKENKEDKLFIIPWDVDGSWGLCWDGTSAGYSFILSNYLFDRLIATNADDFKDKLKLRWSSLRKNLFSDKELKMMFTNNFELINKSDIIDCENSVWGLNIETDYEQEYLLDWIENRTNFLDNYFDNL